MTINWREKGRAAADTYSWGWRRKAGVLLAEPAADTESLLRRHFADLLAAVRWGADLTARMNVDAGNRSLSPGFCANAAEAEALRPLTEGFRERLAEIAEGKP